MTPHISTRSPLNRIAAAALLLAGLCLTMPSGTAAAATTQPATQASADISWCDSFPNWPGCVH